MFRLSWFVKMSGAGRMDGLTDRYPDKTDGLAIVRAVEQPASGSASHWDERTASILTWKQEETWGVCP